MSLRKLDYLIASGELPAFRVPTSRHGSGGHLRIDLDDVDAMLTATPVRSAARVAAP